MGRDSIGRIGSIVLAASGWLFAGIRAALDLIGWSTAPDDLDNAVGLASRFSFWILSIPWWVPGGFALFATVVLAWAFWPRERLSPPTIKEGGTHHQPSEPQHINPLETHFSRRIIRVADLVHASEYTVRDKIFEDCVFYGPGVVCFLAGGEIKDCVIDGNNESIFIEIDNNRNVEGAIGFVECIFRRCRFIGIGILGTNEMITFFKESFSHLADSERR